MSNLLLRILSQTSQLAKVQFEQQTKTVATTQENFLKQVLATHQDTLLGQEENLSDRKSVV